MEKNQEQKKGSRNLFSKKVRLLCLAMVLIPSLSYAIDFTPKYAGGMHIGYGTSSKVNDVKTYSARAMLGMMHGIMWGDYLQTSLGVDAHMLTHYYKGQGLRFAMTGYVDLRGFYPVTSDFSPFIDLALGAGHSIKPSGGKTAFYCEFGPGIKYKKFSLSCGLQRLGNDKGCSHFYVKTGFYF